MAFVKDQQNTPTSYECGPLPISKYVSIEGIKSKDENSFTSIGSIK